MSSLKAEVVFLAVLLAAFASPWFLLGALAWPARLYTTLLLVLLPALVAGQARLTGELLLQSLGGTALGLVGGLWLGKRSLER